ncbi:MAG: hypothetical protein ACRESU_01030, partial [Gammaproteobacteria bacterium]
LLAILMQQELINKINRAEVVAFRCIMAIEFFEAVTGKEKGHEFWSFSQNCLGEVACLLWCHVFNTYSDELHYKNIFDETGASAFGNKFTYSNVQTRLRACINLSEEEYEEFRREVVTVRDKYIAHKETTPAPLKFPRIFLMKAMCLELRDVFAELFEIAYQSDSNNLEYDKWRDYYKSKTRENILKRFAKDLKNAGITG